MSDIVNLIAKLEAWKDRDFHADRQLSDEILVADGWKCEADDTFEGGARWYFEVTPEFVINCSETTRPHVLNDMNAALALVPDGMDWRVSRITGGPFSDRPGFRFEAEISAYAGGVRALGISSEATVALCIAAMRLKLPRK